MGRYSRSAVLCVVPQWNGCGMLVTEAVEGTPLLASAGKDLASQFRCLACLHPFLACLIRDIDLKQHTETFPVFARVAVQGLCNVQAIYTLYVVKWTDGFACLIALQVADEVPA